MTEVKVEVTHYKCDYCKKVKEFVDQCPCCGLDACWECRDDKRKFTKFKILPENVYHDPEIKVCSECLEKPPKKFKPLIDQLRLVEKTRQLLMKRSKKADDMIPTKED